MKSKHIGSGKNYKHSNKIGSTNFYSTTFKELELIVQLVRSVENKLTGSTCCTLTVIVQ